MALSYALNYAHGPPLVLLCVQVDEIFAEYDRDGGVADGQLTLDEFKVCAD